MISMKIWLQKIETKTSTQIKFTATSINIDLLFQYLQVVRPPFPILYLKL